MDGFSDDQVHFQIDFTRPLPFSDESFAGVFSEHVLEHFTFEEGVEISQEVCRILAKGGTFRVIVPDAETIVRAYLEDPDQLLSWRGATELTPMEVVNSYFRQRYEHQFLYDWETMRKMLKLAGFDRVERCQFGNGTQDLLIDDEKYHWESLYVEAVK